MTPSIDQGAAIKARLIAAASELLATEGPEAVQARKVAAKINTSTMVVYTHFGGMGGLVASVALDGFAKFAACLAAVEPSEDSVADLFRLGLAYRDFARDNHQLYRLMFGLSAPAGVQVPGLDLVAADLPPEQLEALAAFLHLVEAVRRATQDRDVEDTDPVLGSLQLWSALHGYVLLEIAGYFGADDAGLDSVLLPLARTIAAGLGQDADEVGRSLELARAMYVRPA